MKVPGVRRVKRWGFISQVEDFVQNPWGQGILVVNWEPGMSLIGEKLNCQKCDG